VKVNRAKMECSREDHPCPRFCISTVMYLAVANGLYSPTWFADASIVHWHWHWCWLVDPASTSQQQSSVLQYCFSTSVHQWSTLVSSCRAMARSAIIIPTCTHIVPAILQKFDSHLAVACSLQAHVKKASHQYTETT